MRGSVKEEVFRALEEKNGETISGEVLASLLQVSRNAVWKAVQSLREEGCEIEACSNKGYRLKQNQDRLSSATIVSALKYKEVEVRVYDEIDSTNNEAKRLIAEKNCDLTLLVAGRQTSGRGRMGRAFYSPANTGVYMTLVLEPKTSMGEAVLLTSAAAVAVVDAIESLCKIKPEIKWVNDIYVDGKKICGILTEAVSSVESGAVQNVLIGIGMNMKTETFPEELRQRAASLNAEGISRNRMIAAITDAFLAIYALMPDKAYLSRYRSHSMVLGKQIIYYENGKSFSALAVNIDDTGALLVRHEDGSEKTLCSGEITLRIA